jgi:hypothetical protein
LLYKNVLQIRRRRLRDQNDEATTVDHYNLYCTKIEEWVEILNIKYQIVSMNS